MWKNISVLLLMAVAAFAQNADEWEPFRKSALFSAKSALWIAPEMDKETVAAFSSRLLDGARQGDAKAKATLGRFFYVRGDTGRAGEWLGKAAEAGHSGAQLDLGAIFAQGIGRPQDLVEAYKWIWLATWDDAPGAAAALREISQKLDGSQVLDGVQRAAKFQDAHMNAAKAPAASGR
ncbi:MAG: hypothetical protein ABI318_09800 [Chthoniobacteraceae bacterium]